MILDERVVKFIENNKDLIQEDNFEDLYREANSIFITPLLTRALLDAGINPLDYLDYVPENYLTSQHYTQDIVIPEHIKEIHSRAFANTLTKNIIMPEGLIHIGPGSFRQSFITSINLPQSLNYIGQGAFRQSSLKEVTIPSKCYLDEWVFTDSELERVTIDEGRDILPELFSGCNQLINVILPSSIKRIKDFCFRDCTKLQELIFKGTMSQWVNEVMLDDYWATRSALKKVICKDGVLDLERMGLII